VYPRRFDSGCVHQFQMYKSRAEKNKERFIKRMERKGLIKTDDGDFKPEYADCDLGCGGQMSWCNCCQVYTSTCCIAYGTCLCS
jgi:hypothetical protein